MMGAMPLRLSAELSRTEIQGGNTVKVGHIPRDDDDGDAVGLAPVVESLEPWVKANVYADPLV
jgi:hypothetical protein